MNSFFATSYAKAKLDKNYQNNPSIYHTVSIVDRLPKANNLKPGITATVEEIPSSVDYYDGSINYKTTTEKCNQWTDKKELCMKQTACGWCSSSNLCISGNNLGPLAPCLRGKFIYTSPKENFNPFTTDNVNVKRQSIGGAQLTTITPK
jgi:hypothetical protein